VQGGPASKRLLPLLLLLLLLTSAPRLALPA